MRVMQPVEREWNEDRMVCTLRDDSPGPVGPWVAVLAGIALFAVVAGLLSGGSVVSMLLLLFALPGFAFAALYAGLSVVGESGTPPTELELRRTVLVIRGSRFVGLNGELGLDEVLTVRARVHPMICLEIGVRGQEFQIPAGSHHPAALEALAAEIQLAADRCRRFVAEQGQASPEQLRAINELLGASQRD